MSLSSGRKHGTSRKKENRLAEVYFSWIKTRHVYARRISCFARCFALTTFGTRLQVDNRMSTSSEERNSSVIFRMAVTAESNIKRIGNYQSIMGSTLNARSFCQKTTQERNIKNSFVQWNFVRFYVCIHSRSKVSFASRYFLGPLPIFQLIAFERPTLRSGDISRFVGSKRGQRTLQTFEPGCTARTNHSIDHRRSYRNCNTS